MDSYKKKSLPFCEISLHEVDCFFGVLFNFMRCHLSINGLNSWANGFLFRRPFPHLYTVGTALFSSSSFGFSGFRFRSFIYLELELGFMQRDK